MAVEDTLKILEDGGISSGYDAALYSAATTYYQQQQAAKTGTTWQYKKGQQAKPKQKQAPKQPQLHYCEVCKISCAGPQVSGYFFFVFLQFSSWPISIVLLIMAIAF